MATHHPYLPTKKVMKYFDVKKKEIKRIKDFFFKFEKLSYNINFKGKHLSRRKITALHKLYNASVYYSDLIVKEVISILENLKLQEDTYVIITSDHGEYLCDKIDHYLWNHGHPHSVYESLIRVPLIIFNKNLKKQVIKSQVQLKDLFHTILHLTGRPTGGNIFLELKKSLFYQINNNDTPKFIFGEYEKSNQWVLKFKRTNKKAIKKGLKSKVFNNMYFLRSNQYKYIKFGNQLEEFYDLINDPYEQYNIINQKNDNFKDLKLNVENIIKEIRNIENLKNYITIKEKDLLKSHIDKLKLQEYK